MWKWIGRLFRRRKKTRMHWGLLGNPHVPVSYRVIYLGADEETKKKMEELYQQDLDNGLFGGRA